MVQRSRSVGLSPLSVTPSDGEAGFEKAERRRDELVHFRNIRFLRGLCVQAPFLIFPWVGCPYSDILPAGGPS